LKQVRSLICAGPITVLSFPPDRRARPLTCEEANSMDSIALGRGDVVVGVDTHKDEHVAVALDGLGGRLGDLPIAANGDGYRQLFDWAATLGRVHAFGVEGTGSYGVGLARFLRRHDVRVIEVSRPPRAGERRLAGKSAPSTLSTPPARCSPAAPPLRRNWPMVSSSRSG
jgi:Transposase